jgi:hypothetical protein
MPKSRTDWIKEELQKDFDAPAQDVADKLRKRGIVVGPQHVYQVRSQVRKAKDERINAARLTREQNTVSLQQHILNCLDNHPNGLADTELQKAIVKAGYVTRAADFLDVLRKKLYEMVEKGHIVKNGLQYKLTAIVAEVAANKPPLPAFVYEDHALLRQAVVDYAKAKGFKNPEGFPDTLIRQRRELLEAQENYRNVFESGGAKNAK